jgi:hypothetical protein
VLDPAMYLGAVNTNIWKDSSRSLQLTFRAKQQQ